MDGAARCSALGWTLQLAGAGDDGPVPFTLAHPAAVLPLARRPLVPAALVAGSLSPDVPYFVPVARSAGAWYEPFVNATWTHTWPGALTVAVPTAAVLLGLWHLVRGPAADLVRAEEPHGPRRTVASGDAVRTSAWAALSLVLGVLTHVAWDSLTHWDGAAVRNVAWLREPLIGGLSAGRVLQHVSTVGGLLVLAVWGARRVAARRARGERLVLDRTRWIVVASLVAIGALGALAALGESHDGGVEAVLAAAAKGGGTAFGAAVLTAAVLHRAMRRRRRAGVPTASSS